MSAGASLPDLLGRTREVRGEEVVHRFANGLTVKTEIFEKRDTLRILPLGSPQCALMNHMANFPELVRGKLVFEPFAGSGPHGFMALALGARHVDFVDINPRAPAFHRDTAALSGLSTDRFTSITDDIARFAPSRRYDLVFANPPFVPTPDGIDGTLTSNGGPEGNRFVEILFRRLDELLEPGGEAFVYLLQIVAGGRPLVVDLIPSTLDRRPVELTSAQRRVTPFDAYRRAYASLFPRAAESVERWRSELVRRHGEDLAVCHYVAHVRPRTEAPTSIVFRGDFAQRFGESWWVPADVDEQIAFGRVLENVVAMEPGARG